MHLFMKCWGGPGNKTASHNTPPPPHSSPTPPPPRAIVSKMAETELDYMIKELVDTKVHLYTHNHSLLLTSRKQGHVQFFCYITVTYTPHVYVCA